MRVPSASTDRYMYFVAVDSSDLKTRETGLSSFTVYRSRNGAAPAAMTTPTINETDASNMPGVYELLVDEDTTITAGNDEEEMVFHITHAGMAPVDRTIELYRPKSTEGETTTVSSGVASANAVQLSGDATAADNLELACDNYSATRGLAGTALPAAAADAAGGLVISDLGGLDLDALNAAAVRLTAARAQVLDDWIDAGRLDAILDAIAADVVNLDGAAMRGTDSAALASAWTAARAAFLDNLNIGENVAGTSEVTAIQNNTRCVRVVPTVIERPDSGTTTYRIELLLYDDLGNMEAPDSAPTLALVNQAGTDLSSRLDATTGTLVSTGRYRWIYTAAVGDTLEQLLWAFSVVEGGNTRIYGNASVIVDTTAVDFTAADRAKLDTLHDTRLTASRADALDEVTAARMAALTDWIDGGRLDLLLDAIPTTAMRGTDNAALASALATAQLDLDTLTGSDGATLATAQGNYAPAVAGDAMALTSGERDAVAAALLDLSAGVESGLTLREALRGFVAALLNISAGGATPTNTFRDLADSKDRISATVDADGNRSAVTLDLT